MRRATDRRSRPKAGKRDQAESELAEARRLLRDVDMDGWLTRAADVVTGAP